MAVKSKAYINTFWVNLGQALSQFNALEATLGIYINELIDAKDLKVKVGYKVTEKLGFAEKVSLFCSLMLVRYETTLNQHLLKSLKGKLLDCAGDRNDLAHSLLLPHLGKKINMKRVDPSDSLTIAQATTLRNRSLELIKDIIDLVNTQSKSSS